MFKTIFIFIKILKTTADQRKEEKTEITTQSSEKEDAQSYKSNVNFRDTENKRIKQTKTFHKQVSKIYLSSCLRKLNVMIDEKLSDQKSFVSLFKNYIFNEKEYKMSLINKYFTEDAPYLIDKTKNYLNNEFEMFFDDCEYENLMKDFINIFNTIKINKNNDDFRFYGIPDPNYTSRLKSSYIKIDSLLLNLDSKSDDQSQIRNKTISERINRIVSILNDGRDHNEKKTLEIYSSKGCLLNPTVLELIDDSIIKLQYDLILISLIFKKIENEIVDFSSIKRFVIASKAFLEVLNDNLENHPGNTDIKKIFDDSIQKICDYGVDVMKTCENLNFFLKKVSNVMKNEKYMDIRKLISLIFIRMNIICYVNLQIKLVSIFHFCGNNYSAKNCDMIPYLLFMSFLDFDKLLNDYKMYEYIFNE